MKAISLWQPWASLWCSPAKIHETRDWPTYHRGWLLVHAAKSLPREIDAELAQIVRNRLGHYWKLLPRGVLIGMVKVIGCCRTEILTRDIVKEDYENLTCGNFAPGRYAWERAEFNAFDPIPFRGRQGLFDVPDSLVPSCPP